MHIYEMLMSPAVFSDMVRWRQCFFLALLLLTPFVSGSKREEDDDDEKDDDEDENDDNGEFEEEESAADKGEQSAVRRTPVILRQTSPTVPATRTTQKRPLECYVCAYRSDTPLRACLDPTKYRVHTMTCHSNEDKCFTSVISKGSSYEAVVRGCRTGCVGTPDVTCCELNRCNHEAFAIPATVSPRALVLENKSSKSVPQSILYFVTILLVLQTVVKVASV